MKKLRLMAKVLAFHHWPISAGQWLPTCLRLCVVLSIVIMIGVLTAGQESRYYIDPRPFPSSQPVSAGTFSRNGGSRVYSYPHNNLVQPALLKPMDIPPVSSYSSVVSHFAPAQLLPPVLLPLTPPPPPPSSPVSSSSLIPPPVGPSLIAPVNSRRQSICYECPGPRACKSDFLWASCDADCIKIDGTILSDRYLPERARDAVAVQGEFRGCFSDRKWSEYLNVIQPNTCAYFEYTKDFPYVHGTVCRCGQDFCNSAARGTAAAKVGMVFATAIFVVNLLQIFKTT